MAVGARHFTMAQLVERTGVAPATVRFYLTAGLLPTPVKASANRFLYDERHVEVIRLIHVLRERRGLSLEAIGQLLPDLLPDLLGKPEGGVFRPGMWGRVLADRSQRSSGAFIEEHLLESGLQAFAERGYAEVTIDDVCRDVGIAKGSFYRYYASKEELFFGATSLVGVRVVANIAAGPMSDARDATRAATLLAAALSPYFGIILDLSSFSVRRRPGHRAALRALFAQICDGLRQALDPVVSIAPDELLNFAIGAVVRDATSESPEEQGGMAPEESPPGA